jgi:hypothetical protein
MLSLLWPPRFDSTHCRYRSCLCKFLIPLQPAFVTCLTGPIYRRAAGVHVPPTLLARADEVIE